MTWTPQALDELRRMAGLGWPAERIAHHLKVTPLAVHGRCARAGIALGANANGLTKPLTAKQARRRDEIAAANASDPLFGIAPPAREDAWRPIGDAEPLRFADCDDRSQCMWPIGDSDECGEWRCCGRSKPAGLPYCPDHTALAYASGNHRRDPAAAALLIRSALRYAA